MSAQDINPNSITPDQFAEMVKGASDDEIASTVSEAGTKDVLDRVFEGFEERFVPEKAQGVDAKIQFVVTHDGAEHPYHVDVAGGSCNVASGTVDDYKTSITTDVVSFVKLVTGQAQGPQLFMSGKLKVGGDLMFSQRVMTFFDQPKA